MDYITNLNPCVTFVPANSSSRNFVTIDSGPTCSSEVGMRGGEQLLYMNAGCFDNGLIVPVHELMHTLGFVHEHNRTLVLAGSWFFHQLFQSSSGKAREDPAIQETPSDYDFATKIQEVLFDLMKVFKRMWELSEAYWVVSKYYHACVHERKSCF